jgi:signal transduction histidine kinase/Tfp pilus assembly protein PilF
MRTVCVCLLLMWKISLVFSQSHEIDSLRKLLPLTPDAKKIDVYQAIIIKLWLNHPDSAMIFAREAVALANKSDDARSKSIAIRLLGGVHYYKGNYDSTIKCSHAAYSLSLLAKDSTLMTGSLNNLGLAYYNVGSYPEALEYLLKALNMKIRIKQDYGMAQTNNNVGLLYTELNNFEKAREYFNKAWRIAGEMKDNDQILYSSNNIGYTFLEQNKLDSARKYFTQSLELAKRTNNANWHSVAFSGFAQVELKENQFPKAQKLLLQSLKLRKEIGEASGISEIYYLFGEIFIKTNKYDSARYYLHKALAIAKGIDDKDLIITTFDQLKQLYIKQRRYDSALFYQTQYIAVRDSVLNENLARNIGDVQVGIEREESKVQLAAKDVQIENITQQAYFLIAAVVLTVFFSFFIYRLYKTQMQLTHDLSKKNEEVSIQREEIRTQKDELALSHAELEKAQEVIQHKNKELQSINSQLQNTVMKRTEQLELANKQLRHVNLELDNFIYRSSHDIRGPLVRLLGVCHVALLDVKDEQAKNYFSMLYDTAQQLNEIFDRLKVVSQINEIELKPESINLPLILENVKTRLSSVEGYFDVEIKQEIEPLAWNSDPFLIETILQNLIENAVRFQKRFTHEKKFIVIKARKKGKEICLSVADNGIGISEATLEHIYQMFSKAARDHRNIGLGLYIVKQSVNKLNGNISLVSNENNFTEFEVVLPTYELVGELV